MHVFLELLFVTADDIEKDSSTKKLIHKILLVIMKANKLWIALDLKWDDGEREIVVINGI